MVGLPLALGILVSGRGSNLQAIVDAIAAGRCPARVAVVVSDRAAAPALDRARAAGLPALALDPAGFPDRIAFDGALQEVLARHGTELVCLAGYLRLLAAPFVAAFRGRILNVHPSLLPAFPGLAAPRQALAHGAKVSGATVHFVDDGLDSGPIVLQAAVPVREDDTEATLAARILAEEHRLYPEAIRLFAEGCLDPEGRRVVIRDRR